MKQLTEYNRASGYLNKIFSLLNHSYFDNTLSKPVITIQSTPKSYGHVSVFDVWLSGEDSRKELNIGAGTLNRNIEDIVATMLHEMVHLFNMQNGVQDTSRCGYYHNKKFRDAAVARDLVIEHHDVIGWSITYPSDKLVQWCIDNDLTEIKVVRLDPLVSIPKGIGGGNSLPVGGDPTTNKKKSSTRKYYCPKCSCSVRATKQVNIICADCNLLMITDFQPD